MRRSRIRLQDRLRARQDRPIRPATGSSRTKAAEISPPKEIHRDRIDEDCVICGGIYADTMLPDGSPVHLTCYSNCPDW